MVKNMQTTRRNFLSTLALLTTGSLIAGTPPNVFDNNSSIEKSWDKFIAINNGASFFNISDIKLPSPAVTSGHEYKPGDIIRFTKEKLLAQPTWIYWNNNSKAADIVISFFEDTAPFKKIRTLNRFEMEAFIRIAAKEPGRELLPAICYQQPTAANKLLVKTRISRNKQVHDISLYENNHILFKQQLFFHV